MSNESLLIDIDEEALLEAKHQQEISAEVFLFLVFSMVIAICKLKTTYPAQMRQAGLVFLWLYPLTSFWYHHSWHIALMLVLWTIWTSRTLFLMNLARAKPLHPTTPEKVYKWFLMSHKICYVIAMNSIYMLLIFPGLGLLLLFFALYFGTLNSDVAVTISEKMSNTVGYLKHSAAPFNLCALCGEELRPSMKLMAGEADSGEEETKILKLSCDHEFHENCIRGWCIVGKKDMCPFCCEKIDMKHLIPESAWNSKRLSIIWIRMLSVLRWLIVWNPIIVYTSLFFLRILHFAPPNDS